MKIPKIQFSEKNLFLVLITVLFATTLWLGEEKIVSIIKENQQWFYQEGRGAGIIEGKIQLNDAVMSEILISKQLRIPVGENREIILVPLMPNQ